MTNENFSSIDYEKIQEFSLGPRWFFSHMGFKGNCDLLAKLDRRLSNEIIVESEDIDCLKLWVTWNLLFGRETVNPLWVLKDLSKNSPIEYVKSVVEKLGKLAIPIHSESSRFIRMDNDHQLAVSPIHPNAGLGMSMTDLVIEGFEPNTSEWNELVRNIIPVLYSVTGGKGMIITVV